MHSMFRYPDTPREPIYGVELDLYAEFEASVQAALIDDLNQRLRSQGSLSFSDQPWRAGL